MIFIFPVKSEPFELFKFEKLKIVFPVLFITPVPFIDDAISLFSDVFNTESSVFNIISPELIADAKSFATPSSSSFPSGDALPIESVVPAKFISCPTIPIFTVLFVTAISESKIELFIFTIPPNDFILEPFTTPVIVVVPKPELNILELFETLPDIVVWP